MASFSRTRPWLFASFIATNVAACAALDAGFGDNVGGGGGGGAWGANGGNGGVIDYDAGGGGTGGHTTGEYAHLCGRGTCEVSSAEAVTSCVGQGAGGSGGGAGGAGAGSAGGGGAGGSSETGGGPSTGGNSGAGGTGGTGTGTTSGTGGAGTGGNAEAGGAGTGGNAEAGGTGTGGTGTGGSAGTGGAGTGGSAGTGGNAGTGGAGTGGSAGTGGNAGTGGAGTGGAGGAGTGGAGGGEGPTVIECKIAGTDDGPVRTCVESSGTYAELSPCNTAADCGPGLGCVLAAPNEGTGVCRPYCCGDVEECANHTYCTPRPMAEPGQALLIPVCVDADQCTLLEQDQCPEGLACAVVRADGTTACVPPGPGKQGEACPCAAGFACTKLVNECREICHTDAQASPDECATGFKCQGNASLPDGFGLCVSTSDL